MKYFINNLKLLFNFRILIVIAVCISINIFYSGENISKVIYGVEGSFSMVTAIPWLALLIPYFLATGFFIAQREDNKIFILSRIKSRKSLDLHTLAVIIASALLYCAFYSVVSLFAGGAPWEIFIAGILMFFNLIFLSGVQWITYSLFKNISASMLVPFSLIVLSLVFYKCNLIPGAWAMLERSSLKDSNGFELFIIIPIEIILPIILKIFVKEKF